MFKNGGLLLKKRSVAPIGVDKDCIILFLNEQEQLSIVDSSGYVSLINSDQIKQQVTIQYDSSTIPSNYDDLMISTNTFFGDGSDGDIELESLFILNRDYYFKNVKLNKNGIIKVNGYRLFVQESLILNGGIITNDGNDASTQDMYNIGKLGGIETKYGSIGQGSPGGKGSNGSILDGKNTNQNITFPITNGGNGGFGGNGGDGQIGKGGRSIIESLSNKYMIRNVYLALQGSKGTQLINGGVGGDGGAAGGGDSNQCGGGGGGGGSGGGVIQIIAKTITITPNASYPSIRSNGGNGSNGSDAFVGNCGGGGGGSGGGGGYIQIFFLNKNLELNDGLIDAKGGIPGNGGNGSGIGKRGIIGGIGNIGNIECVNVKSGIWSLFVGSSTVQGYK